MTVSLPAPKDQRLHRQNKYFNKKPKS